MFTIHTLYYVLLWAIMMLIGGLFYVQPLLTKKRGKKLKVLELVGGFTIVMAMFGLLHGVLSIFHLILPL